MTENSARRELPGERLDRHWNEILQELRVAQTGVQILSGFLLTVPFQSRFPDLTDGERLWFLVVVVAACATTVTMLSPVLLHRTLFRKQVRDVLVRVADVMLQVSFGLLAVVVTGAVGLVVEIADGPAIPVMTGMVLLLIALWLVLPLLVSRRAENHAA